MMPLISVMIPCYNDSVTLPLTLASLMSQTYTQWECIIVDDGSTDNPIGVLNKINDNRIRFHRFEKNRGRAIARQQALDMATGKYLCMIDADDWIYPGKLERQVEVMEKYPEIALVSTGMAIVNKDNHIVGIRQVDIQSSKFVRFESLRGLRSITIPFAPSMLRTNIAKQFNFDPDFTIAEDKDYLLQIMMNYPVGIIPDPLYVYSEIDSVTLSKILQSLEMNRNMYLKYRNIYPIATAWSYALSLIKENIYRMFFFLGFGNWLITKRSQTPTFRISTEYADAHQIVVTTYRKIFTHQNI